MLFSLRGPCGSQVSHQIQGHFLQSLPAARAIQQYASWRTVITYRATLDVSMDLLRFVTRLLILERRRRCTPAGSRALTCREQAVMVLRRFRDRARAGQLGRDHGISRATAYRYVDEGTPFVILDGKLTAATRAPEPASTFPSRAPAKARSSHPATRPGIPCCAA